MIVGTAGHIDHGKTTLVRALTGVETDRLKEEKARGISIELGYAYTPLANGDILGFIDVPGHERLVQTMAAGSSGPIGRASCRGREYQSVETPGGAVTEKRNKIIYTIENIKI